MAHTGLCFFRMGSLTANQGISDPIELISDDDDDDIAIIEDAPARKHKRSRIPTECLNVQCKTGQKYTESVPVFILEYFKVKNKKGLKVCEECFDEACTYYTVSFNYSLSFQTMKIILSIYFTEFKGEIGKKTINLSSSFSKIYPRIEYRFGRRRFITR